MPHSLLLAVKEEYGDYVAGSAELHHLTVRPTQRAGSRYFGAKTPTPNRLGR